MGSLYHIICNIKRDLASFSTTYVTYVDWLSGRCEPLYHT